MTSKSSPSTTQQDDDDHDRRVTIFTNAFNRQRPTLAGFASCNSIEELHYVRDAFYIGLAHDLCPQQYADVATSIVINPMVATAAGTSSGAHERNGCSGTF